MLCMYIGVDDFALEKHPIPFGRIASGQSPTQSASISVPVDVFAMTRYSNWSKLFFLKK